MRLCYQKIHSPLGTIHIATDGENLRALALEGNWDKVKNRLDDWMIKSFC